MTTLGLISTFAAFAGGGVALDAWMTARNKRRLYDRMVAWFVRLDERRVLDLPVLVAERAANWTFAVLGPRLLSLRAVAVGTTLSAGLTFGMVQLGWWLDDYRHSDGSLILVFEPESLRLFLRTMIPANLVFDWATVLLGIVAIRAVLKQRRPVTTWAIGFASVLGAFALAYGCMLFNMVLDRWHKGLPVDGKDVDWFLDYYPRFLWTVVGSPFRIPEAPLGQPLGNGPDYTVGLFASTTLLPTLLFWMSLGLLGVLKGLLAMGRFLAIQWIDVEAEKVKGNDVEKFKPFTLIGTALGFLVAVAKAVAGGGP